MKTHLEINTVVHYAPINIDEDILPYPFENLNELLGFVLAEASYEVVHLVSIDNNIFVSHGIAEIGKFIKSYKDYLIDGIDIFWQEYDSYEAAYRVALSMQETSIFCYSDNKE